MSSYFYYIFCLLFIAGWWFGVFYQKVERRDARPLSGPLLQDKPHPFEKKRELPIPWSTQEELIAALGGDWQQLADLLLLWDEQAAYLQELGLSNIGRIEGDRLLLAHHRAKRLARGDEEGTSSSPARYLPQTWASASFLLALLPPTQIAALPSGYRELQTWLPVPSRETLPHESSRLNSELFSHQVELAFVAEYTSSSTLETLKRQGVALYRMSVPNTIEELRSLLLEVGAAVHSEEKAQLLDLLIEAALLSLDNRKGWLSHRLGKTPFNRPLLLLDFSSWHLPAFSSFTAQWMARLGLPLTSVAQESYSLASASLEQLTAWDPDLLIIATEPSRYCLVDEQLQRMPLAQLTACLRGSYGLVDLAPQQELSQYSLIAYQQLIELLERLTED